MLELELLPSLLLFLSGVVVGILASLGFNKIQTGSASPRALKKEKDQYQSDVEAHFEETSNKFKAMATQYQDLYQHLSVGATTLCRPENVAAGLADKSKVPLVGSLEAKAVEAKPITTKSVDPKISEARSADKAGKKVSKAGDTASDKAVPENGGKSKPSPVNKAKDGSNTETPETKATQKTKPASTVAAKSDADKADKQP